ncbi:rhodanese-like domain-containing protein [Vicingus serpentipes]|jgi:phage shock protein E|uniref:Rhodanese-like domain-containing protein n=1 Tax=Vicingus serpentipes TaxID=1926625 RepID=A0A5C6RPU6_9FLAO|nr:rhodanese-like domain-containing protein [Vicingus serpentipes]TXB63985.1 rhodanese-like domain-containing protein [Vicingus serpentipes]
MSFLRKLFGLGPKVNHHELIANGAVLIDVRTPAEFSAGNAKGSKNIPLDTIGSKVKKIEQLKKPVVLICRSGMRSGQATAILKRNGIEAYNGGPWNNFA